MKPLGLAGNDAKRIDARTATRALWRLCSHRIQNALLLRPLTATPRELAKWCAYTLVLLAPGSFIVLPLLWLYRQVALQQSVASRRLVSIATNDRKSR